MYLGTCTGMIPDDDERLLLVVGLLRLDLLDRWSDVSQSKFRRNAATRQRIFTANLQRRSFFEGEAASRANEGRKD